MFSGGGASPVTPPTVIAAAAATLAANNWVQLSAATNQVSVLSGGASAPITLSMNNAAWCPTRKEAHHICKEAGTPVAIKHAVYREDTHEWVRLSDDVSTPLGTGGHGYDYNMADPVTERIFFKNHDVARTVYYADPPNYTWASGQALSLWPNHGGGDLKACPAWFWSGTLTGGGTGGFVMLAFNSDSTQGTADVDIDIPTYDVQNGTWFSPNQKIVDANPSGGGGTFQNWGAYSPVSNCAVIITGEGALSNYRTWRINSDRTSTALTAPPKKFGYNEGSIVEDPATGNFLCLANDGTFYELDPTGTGTWTQLTGAAAPPAELWPLSSTPTTCWAITAHGVTVWTSGQDGHMFLYKHS